MKSRVRARANIAVIKYWGKAEADLNIPAVGSISMTLDRLWSDTEVEFDSSLVADTFSLGGESRPDQLARVSGSLGLLRRLAGVEMFARVASENNFPTGAGLASSASGFAALCTAGAQALSLNLSPRELSMLARQGSGSAARSIFGGYVEMHAGNALDGSDSFAEPLLEADMWPLECVIAITQCGEKEVSSRAGMEQSASTSAYYPAWVASSENDLRVGRAAVLAQDFDSLAEIAEHSCLKMHAAVMANQPPLIYWNPTTLACIHVVRTLRTNGFPVFFTIDAGPQVKVFCKARARADVVAALEQVPGVEYVIVSGLGSGVEIL